MKLIGKVVSSGCNKLYIVNNIDICGILSCTAVDEVGNCDKKEYRLDPLTVNVYDTEINCIGIESFSGNELYMLSKINKYIKWSEVKKVLGYSGKHGRYLFIVYMTDKRIHVIDISQSSIYGVSLCNGTANSIKDIYNVFDYKTDFSEYYPNIEFMKSAKLYKMFCDVNQSILETCGRLFHGFCMEERVDINIFGSNTCSFFKIKYKNNSSVINAKDLYNIDYREVRLNRKYIEDELCSYFENPCGYFNDDELLKLKGILESYNYGFMYNHVVNGNCTKSNFKVEGRNNEYLCIRDLKNNRSYSVCILRLHKVKTFNGKTLFYEVRMYPLCENGRYTIVMSSRSKSKCEKLLNCKYGNLIRGNLLKLKSFPFELVHFKDTSTYIEVRYSIRSKKEIYRGVYNKYTHEWNLTKDSDTNEDLGFLEVLVKIFNSCTGLLNVEEDKFSIYKLTNGKFSTDFKNCIGVTCNIKDCGDIVYNNDCNKFIIEWCNRGIRKQLWLYNKIKRSLVKL